MQVTRRGLIVAGAGLAAPQVAAADGERSRFLVFRNGARIGEHLIEITGSERGARVITSNAHFVVRLGPIPVYRYQHEAREEWDGAQFKRLVTTTDGNGKREAVKAYDAGDKVVIESSSGRAVASRDAAPLTHWNPQVFARPLFNPQTGKLLKVGVTHKDRDTIPITHAPGIRWSVRGDASIDDWYDATGRWAALRGRLTDGSLLEYRRA